MKSSVRSFQFAHCRLDYYPEAEYCETVFPDGARCEASPMRSAEYLKTAADLGYGTSDRELMDMCLAHEMLHTVLAEARGLEVSPTLRAVADGVAFAGAIEEESVVMRAQRFLGVRIPTSTTETHCGLSLERRHQSPEVKLPVAV